eukprot:684841-Pelagomonas_calceolata.AAC.3
MSQLPKGEQSFNNLISGASKVWNAPYSHCIMQLLQCNDSGLHDGLLSHNSTNSPCSGAEARSPSVNL